MDSITKVVYLCVCREGGGEWTGKRMREKNKQLIGENCSRCRPDLMMCIFLCEVLQIDYCHFQASDNRQPKEVQL